MFKDIILGYYRSPSMGKKIQDYKRKLKNDLKWWIFNIFAIVFVFFTIFLTDILPSKTISNNIVKKTSELIDNIIIVIFSPEDLKIVKDEPEKRRRFIDRELAQIKPAYYDCLSNYKKILAHRNAHLKEDFIDSSILEVLDEQLISYGSTKETFTRENLTNTYGTDLFFMGGGTND